MRLILGSQSLAAAVSLAGLDIPFEAINIDAEEWFPTNLTAGDIPLYISREKAQAYTRLQADELLVTADTIMRLNGRIFGQTA